MFCSFATHINLFFFSTMNRVSIHGAVRGREAVLRLVARLETLCATFGAALDDSYAIFRAATTAATRHTLSELRVRTDRSDGGVAMTTLSQVAQRQTGAAGLRASVCAVSEVSVGSNAAEFVTQLGFRFDYGFRRVGACGVAYAGQLKVHVALFQILSLSGDLLPPAVADGGGPDELGAGGGDMDDNDVWMLELETLAPARFVPEATDALYQWAARLYPIVELGTVDAQAFSTARQQLVNFRVQLTALENAAAAAAATNSSAVATAP